MVRGVLLDLLTVLIKLYIPINVLPKDPAPPMPEGTLKGQGVLFELFTILKCCMFPSSCYAKVQHLPCLRASSRDRVSCLSRSQL